MGFHFSSHFGLWAIDFSSEYAKVCVFFLYRRGLSKFYQGKSQSFTSLTNVKSLEDFAKPESPYNKKLKSYGFYENQDSILKYSFK
jgi:hypothetical protein